MDAINESLAPQENHDQARTSSSGTGRELLGFSSVHGSRRALVNSLDELSFCHVSAQLGGMLFVAETPSDRPLTKSPAAVTLTCYRRNLLRVSGRVYLPREARVGHGLDGGRGVALSSVHAYLSAFETLQDAPTKIITSPWRRKDSAGAGAADEIEPLSIKLDLAANPDRHSDPCPFDISWERLQFRQATMKSNRPSVPQQYFRLAVEVRAEVDGDDTLLCRSISVPIDVRGRSPRSYNVQSSGESARGSIISTSSRSKTLEGPVVPAQDTIASQLHPDLQLLWSVDTPIVAPPSGEGDCFGDLLATPYLAHLELTLPDQHVNDGVLDLHPNAYGAGSLPLDFDFADDLTGFDDLGNSGLDLLNDLRKAPCQGVAHEPPAAQPEAEHAATRDPHVEHSYEYFPLAASDWTPPAQAVYRPHYVHHRRHNRAEDKLMRKRYFRED